MCTVHHTSVLMWRCVYRASYCNVLMWRCVYRASYYSVLMWRCVYRASYCNVLMTNGMHSSYNQFLFHSFLSALRVSNESSRSPSWARHNILYYTVCYNRAGESSCFQITDCNYSSVCLHSWYDRVSFLHIYFETYSLLHVRISVRLSWTTSDLSHLSRTLEVIM